MKRIEVDPPTGEARRDRIERQLFAQLATVRAADRADAAVPAARTSRRGWMMPVAFGVFAVAVSVLVTISVARSNEPAIERDSAPSRVVTPIGGSSSFTVGDAVIIAGSDTSVDVKHGEDGSTTLFVGRGSVDCDVAPRNGRPPFHVVAGDVSVEVVGTRFTVTRTPAARVDVVRGKVRVTAPGGTWLVGAGESWTPQVTAAAAAAGAVRTSDIEIDPMPAPASMPMPAPIQAPAPAPMPPPSAHAAYQAAERLESTDHGKAALAYRSVANGKDTWAALALYSLVELHATGDAMAALRECDEYAKRFPSGANAEDITWLRVDILLSAGRRDEARAAATEYLRQFPNGTYAGTAARIASPQP